MRINPFSSSSFSFFMIFSSTFWTIIITLYSFLKFHMIMLRVKWGRATKVFNSFNIKTIIFSHHIIITWWWFIFGEIIARFQVFLKVFLLLLHVEGFVFCLLKRESFLGVGILEYSGNDWIGNMIMCSRVFIRLFFLYSSALEF